MLDGIACTCRMPEISALSAVAWCVPVIVVSHVPIIFKVISFTLFHSVFAVEFVV